MHLGSRATGWGLGGAAAPVGLRESAWNTERLRRLWNVRELVRGCGPEGSWWLKQTLTSPQQIAVRLNSLSPETSSTRTGVGSQTQTGSTQQLKIGRNRGTSEAQSRKKHEMLDPFMLLVERLMVVAEALGPNGGCHSQL